ncbi:MAG: hypothetical protein ACSW8F_03290 [bacterium]
MKDGLKIAKALVWLTQLGFSVAIPPVVFIAGAVWLRDRMGLGAWVVVLGVVVGVLGAAGGLISSFRSIRFLLSEEDGKKPPPSFNDHE